MNKKYEEYMGDLSITTRSISPYIPHILQQLNIIIKYLILKIHLAPLLSSSSAHALNGASRCPGGVFLLCTQKPLD
jgi:hypothetical protein